MSLTTNNKENVSFIFNQKLPLTYEVVIAVYDYAPKINSEKRKKALGSMASSLYSLWYTCFGKVAIITRKYVRERLKKELKKFQNKVIKTTRVDI